MKILQKAFPLTMFDVNRDRAVDLLDKNKYYSLIFSHIFAKHIWGEALFCCNCSEEIKEIDHTGMGNCFCSSHSVNVLPAYQFHLSQMVICDEPLDYLKGHI